MMMEEKFLVENKLLMEEKLIEHLEKLDLVYCQIKDNELLEKISDLWVNDDPKIIELTHLLKHENGIFAFYIGSYFEYIGNWSKAMEYYLIAIDCGCSYAMLNLATHYNENGENKLAEKYYFMSLDHGNEYSMVSLGSYFKNTHNNFDLMKHYYLMSIDQGNIRAMYLLGKYYEIEGVDYNTMLKYYLMAIDKGCAKSKKRLIEYFIRNAMFNQLLLLYIKINDINEMLGALLKYNFKCEDFTSAEYNTIVDFLHTIDHTHYINNNGNLIFKLLINSFKNNLDILHLHFNYSIHSKGYDEAKNDFMHNLKMGKIFGMND